MAEKKLDLPDPFRPTSRFRPELRGMRVLSSAPRNKRRVQRGQGAAYEKGSTTVSSR